MENNEKSCPDIEITDVELLYADANGQTVEQYRAWRDENEASELSSTMTEADAEDNRIFYGWHPGQFVVADRWLDHYSPEFARIHEVGEREVRLVFADGAATKRMLHMIRPV